MIIPNEPVQLVAKGPMHLHEIKNTPLPALDATPSPYPVKLGVKSNRTSLI